jgi:hypothetical protein
MRHTVAHLSACWPLRTGARFALRTRVLDMVMDEYHLEGQYPGNLGMAGEIDEFYEWLQGPLATHFLCHEPPVAGDVLNGSKPMCYLPDGAFIADNVIELRQVRVKPQVESRLHYFTSSRPISIAGAWVISGSEYSDKAARDTTSPWVLPAAGGAGEPLSMPFESATYRSKFAGLELRPLPRWGWYDVYDFGGFVYRSSPQANATVFRAAVDQLRASQWIDRLTRAITVSTVLLNPATGLGCLVTVLLETPREGVMRVSPKILVMHQTEARERGFFSHVVNQPARECGATFFFYSA